MTKDTTSVQPQAGATDNLQPQAGNTPPEPQAGDGKQQYSQEDYERIVADLRKENAGHRTKLKKFEDEERTRTEAQMTEQQRLQNQYTDLKAQHDKVIQQQQETRVRTSVERMARQMGFVDDDAAARLLNWPEIEYDEKGSPKNVEDLLKKLLKDKPYLAGKSTPSANVSATNPSRSTSSSSPLSWDTIGKMTAAEYEARRSEIQTWMQANPHKYGQRLK